MIFAIRTFKKMKRDDTKETVALPHGHRFSFTVGKTGNTCIVVTVKKTIDDGRSLFDEEGGASCTPAGESPATYWEEVPQLRFLSWPSAMQAAYCRDRDLDSTTRAESDWWAQFYLERAKGYDDAVSKF